MVWMRRHRQPRIIASWTFLLWMTGATAAWAQGDETDINLYEWSAPSIIDQLRADRTSVPAERGAVFVPTMTLGAEESEVFVYREGERVTSSPTGVRIVLVPGDYEVLIGSGTLTQMLTIPAEVRAGETFIITPEWGALRIEVVDDNNIPHRGTYELIRASDREVFGLGYGADMLQGESLRTWLLPPGLYRIVQPGSTYRARTDFATVYIPQGGLVHFKLVIDPLSGDFRGAGVVTPDEFGFAKGESDWTHRMVLGVTGALSDSSNSVGQADQMAVSGNLFLDTYVTWTPTEDHLLAVIFEVEEGLLLVDPEQGDTLPIQKSRDRVRFDTLYTYFFNNRIGAYGRVGALTAVFPNEVLTTEAISVIQRSTDGMIRAFTVPAGDAFRVGDWFPSSSLAQGLGVNFRILHNQWATVNLRTGLGLRQYIYRDAYIEADNPDTAALEYDRVDSYNQEGLEATLNGIVRFFSYIYYTTDLEVFSDFTGLDEPTIDWQNTVSLRLSSFASLDYTLDLRYQPEVTDEVQLLHNLLVRLSFEVN